MMKIAVIGLGVIGKLHAELTMVNGDLVAVCDIDEAQLSLYPNIKHYTNYVDMLDEVELDAIHVCTPHYLHAEMVVEALKRNVNVLCEKPLCINDEQLNTILLAEENSKAQLGVCFQNRYLSVNSFVKNFLKENPPISAVGLLAWNRDEKYYSSSDWRGKKETEGGGVLINQAIHTIDLLQYFCGEPSYVCANVCNMTLQNVIDVEDTAVLKCKGEVPFEIFATNGSKTDFPIQIMIKTEKGLLKVTSNQVVLNDEIIYTENLSKYHIKPCYGFAHDFLIDDFYDCLKKGKKFSLDGKEGAKALKIVLSAYSSYGKDIKI